jgi:hypothetical protein
VGMLFKFQSKKDLFLAIILLLVFNLIEYLIPSRIGNKAGYITGALTLLALVEIFQFIFKQYGLVFFFIVIVALLAAFQYISFLINVELSKAYLYGVYAGVVIAILLRLYMQFKKKHD